MKCQNHAKEFYTTVCNLANIPHNTLLTAVDCIEDMSKVRHLTGKQLLQTEATDVQEFISRPIMHYIVKENMPSDSAQTRRGYTFVDAVSHFGDLLMLVYLAPAYKCAGSHSVPQLSITSFFCPRGLKYLIQIPITSLWVPVGILLVPDLTEVVRRVMEVHFSAAKGHLISPMELRPNVFRCQISVKQKIQNSDCKYITVSMLRAEHFCTFN
jgi:hypothetical protein